MPRICEASIVEAVLAGIEKSHKDFYKGTGGFFMNRGPEYVITTNILQQLWKNKLIAFPEDNLRELMKMSGTKDKGKFKDIIRPRARCDIAVYSTSCLPICAIEIKRHAHDVQQLKKDFCRLEELIVPKADYTSFRYGISAFYVVDDTSSKSDGRTKLEEFLQNLEHDAEKECPAVKAKLHPGKIHLQSWENNIWDGETEGESAWAAACLLFKRKAK